MNQRHHEDRDLLHVLLAEDAPHEDALSGTERKAFTSMLNELASRGITVKQRGWLHDVCERVGIIGSAPARNLFSSLTEKAKREELRRAEKVKVNVGPKVLRPPVKCRA